MTLAYKLIKTQNMTCNGQQEGHSPYEAAGGRYQVAASQQPPDRLMVWNSVSHEKTCISLRNKHVFPDFQDLNLWSKMQRRMSKNMDFFESKMQPVWTKSTQHMQQSGILSSIIEVFQDI